MGYTRKNGKMFSWNGQGVQRWYVWENFMDRLDSGKEHYLILNKRGNMMGTISRVPKKPTIPAVVDKQKQKKICDNYELSHTKS